MLDNDRNNTSTLAVLQKRETAQRSETPKGASETPIDWLARTRVSLRTDFALAVLGAGRQNQRSKIPSR